MNCQDMVFPSWNRRGGCASKKKTRSLRSGADGVVIMVHVDVVTLFGTDHPVCAFIRRLRSIFLMAQPPLLSEEGNTLSCNSFTPSPSAPFRNGTFFYWRVHPSFARRGILCYSAEDASNSNWLSANFKPSLFSRCCKAIADPRFGQDVLGFGGIGFNLLTKMGNEDAQIVGLIAVVRPPDRLKQFPVRHGFSSL